MSKKKHRQEFVQQTGVAHTTSTNQEYAIVGHDLARVLLLNGVYLAGILVLYYTNHNSHYLERFFSNLFHWY